MTFVQDRPAQSTAARRTLQGAPAALLLVLISAAFAPVGTTLGAQTATVQRDGEPFFAEARGAQLGRFAPDIAVRPGQVRGGFTEVPLEGWIVRSSTQPTSRDGRDLQVSREENLRAAPNGRLVGRVVPGTLFNEVERRGAWVRVRRTVWVRSSGLRMAAAASAAPSTAPVPPAVTAQAPAPRRDTVAAATARRDTSAAVRRDTAAARRDTAHVPAADPRRAVVRRRMNLYRAPDSTAIGTLEAGVPVRITGRAGEWVRVEAQAWVRENEIRPSDIAILTGVSAAELRGAPEEFQGRLLRWTIQFLALQTADELRSDFTPGQRYILARGPAPEYAFVYITVPPSRIAEVERLAPLASVDVVARVVTGRSAFLANPILDLVDMP
jgi:hypothetical protein